MDQGAILRRIVEREPLTSILDAIARHVQATSGVPGAFCTFMRYDAFHHQLNCVVAPDLPPSFCKELVAVPVSLMDDGACGAAAHTRRPQVSPDVLADPRFAKYVDFIRRYEIGACWSTPVESSDGRLLGTFALYSHTPIDESAVDLEMVQRNARLVAIAVERQEGEEQRARHTVGQRLIAETSARLLNLEDRQIDEAMREILARTADFTGADRVQLWTYQSKPATNAWGTATVRAAWARPGIRSPALAKTFELGDLPWVSEMVHDGRTCMVERLSDLEVRGATEDARRMREAGVSAFFCAPVWSRGELSAGLRLDCFGRDHAWDSETVAMARVVGELLATALERRATDARIRHQALHDALTGLPNRYLLRERLARDLAGVNPAPQVLFFVDVDRFKIVNDSLGHAAGDLVLSTVAERLRLAAGDGAMVARVGGDEFVVLSPIAAAPPSVQAARLVESLELPIEVLGRRLDTSVSVGGALAPQHGTTPDAILGSADLALYAAKSGGGNRWLMYDQALEARYADRLGVERGLAEAVERGELELRYQPIVEPLAGTVERVEALLRWRHPERGLLAPAAFLSIAEETGFILPIGRWVLETACHEAASWKLPDGSRPRLAVNLSARQIHSHGFARFIAATLEKAGLPPSALEVEITESVALSDLERSRLELLEFKRLGIAVALDDFGTGYASLNYLQRLPIDTLKLDGTFTRGLGQRETDTIVRAVIDLAHELGMHVIAEGVERRDQAEFLTGVGCDGLQGYLVGAPLDAEGIRARIGALEPRLPVGSPTEAPAPPS